MRDRLLTGGLLASLLKSTLEPRSRTISPDPSSISAIQRARRRDKTATVPRRTQCDIQHGARKLRMVRSLRPSARPYSA